MSYTVHQAKTNFSRILREVEEGKEIIVTRGKKPVARIMAIEPPTVARRVPGGFEGLVHADDSAFAPLTDQELVEYGFGFMLEGGRDTKSDTGDKTGHAG
ncbi:MAG TPA: type II toxin-antitoxin system prevent-host-death family antitoxin [Terracidiphilus sp.]|jgi:prevent-host-death family protein|nr:type II toxin-antitoxin system prevent-host-death family antitoxin [Terracidiphilus sp.]